MVGMRSPLVGQYYPEKHLDTEESGLPFDTSGYNRSGNNIRLYPALIRFDQRQTLFLLYHAF
jgi:hypothetical protein